jgi:two-component system C4-dicarboxylate transport response regulator DctD
VIVVCDVRLPGLSGSRLAPEIRAIDAELPVVLFTGHGHIAMAVEAMREGAYDFIESRSPRSGWWRWFATPSNGAADAAGAKLHDALENWHGIRPC